MPEYLAPAVYVEEVDTGSKPIEGVSTSTTGMIGVTERGPVNVPTLVTSFGEYQRTFGQMLNAADYQDHRYLPNAVEGFFTNGGKRVFVTRVLELQAAPRAAERALVAPDAAPALQARLLRPALPGATSVTIDADPGFLNGDLVQVDEGLNADFVALNAAPAPANLVAVRRPLAFAHAAADTVRKIDGTDNTTAGETHSDTTNLAAAAGASALTLANPVATFAPALAAGDVFRLDTGDAEELVVAAAGSASSTLQLTAPLQLDHALGAQVHRIVTANAAVPASSAIPPNEGANPGDVFFSVTSNTGLTTESETVEITCTANPVQVEYRRLGAFQRIPLDQGAYAAYPPGTRVERVTAGAAAAPACDIVGGRDAAPGDTVLNVSSRTGMAAGLVLEIGVAPQLEYIEIASLSGAPLPPPNAGAVVLRAPLRFPHSRAALGTVRVYSAPTAPANGATSPLETPVDATALAVNRSGFAAGDLLRVTPPTGGPYYHTAQGASVAYIPVALSLGAALGVGHSTGIAVARRAPFMTVRALDAGRWGNRLRAAMEEQDPPLLATTIREVLPGGDIRLTSTANVELGTELVVTDATNTETTFRVHAIDRLNNFRVTPMPALPAIVAAGDAVRSREFRFVVELLRQEDLANPARNSMAIDREIFPNLSLDNRHSRYFEKVIGCTWNLLNPATQQDDRNRALRRSDRRSEGESQYIRVLDAGFAASQNVRPGPVASYEQRPGAPRKLVLLPLGGGFDDIGSITDQTYIGQDNVNPEQRTGLFTLRNVEDISIIGAPGRTTPAIQNALINHCELMRYRFAVLDGPPPPADSIPDVQAQRQQFDTKYAALYHPWLLTADPFPVGPIVRQDYPIPPSGHMLGIYARTDIERGVHKAPANEVVRGVIGLRRILNKEQHDILNPYPVNINVIRDFRTNNRGIRVYGGRCITSDSDWKYVNVRRLLIFIEASIDRGLQWVVFEPNAEPLWARVRRAISNFLTLVWRNGALEGTKVEEAFFVKCDRTTMTQTDIDQGRLICLVGVAPVKPAEFVIVRIGLWTAHAED
jgi:phage tail sheath protein FI